MLTTANTEENRERCGKNAGEWTGRVTKKKKKKNNNNNNKKKKKQKEKKNEKKKKTQKKKKKLGLPPHQPSCFAVRGKPTHSTIMAYSHDLIIIGSDG